MDCFHYMELEDDGTTGISTSNQPFSANLDDV